MKDLGDYIYLIFIAIAVISSFFGKKKKKEMSQPTEHPAPSTNWQDIIKQMAEGKESVNEPEPVQEAPMKSTADTISPVQLVTTSVQAASEGTRSIIHKTAPIEDEDTAQSSILVELDEQDDAIKAVVYSEILTRKY
ncbi:MAG: hypothetical protein H6543_05660 [Prevotellaceae bacterium]|nr:hypothetical protein [Prevotellaceae bacterium]